MGHSQHCPVLPKAEACANKCHQNCAKANDVKCFADCLEESDCDGMENECVDCIETCAATKLVVKESLDRGIFEMPTLKAHFTNHYLEANNMATPAVPDVGRFRDEEETSSKKKKKNKNKKNKQPRENKKTKKSSREKKDKQMGTNGKKIGSKRQQKQEKRNKNQ